MSGKKREGGLRIGAHYKESRPGKPLVTIVTVVRNARDELLTTLKSVLNQTYDNIEYIIIDGASSDGTVELIEAHDGEVDYWISEPDSGPYDAMNLGIDLASGEWINFMNAGDSFNDPDVVKDVFTAVPSQTDFIYGHHLYVLPGRPPQRVEAADFDQLWREMKAADFSLRWLRGIPCHQSQFIKTRRLKADKFDLSFKIAADHNFMFSLYAATPYFFNTRRVIAVYNGGGMSQNNHIRCLREQWRIIKKYQKSLRTDIFFLGVIKLVLKARRNIPGKIIRTIDVVPGWIKNLFRSN